VPQGDEVLIQVGACGMNNTDINTRTGWYSKTVREGTHAEGGTKGFDQITEEAGGWGEGLDFPRIQGADVCGRVVAAGPDADDGLIGKRVLIDTWLRDWSDPMNLDKCGYYGSEADGGYAQFTKVSGRHAQVVESALTDAELATFATSYITAENMLHRANVGGDDTVLVPGASGGVGSALIQLAKRRGAQVIALSGESKADQVRDVGADAVLPRSPQDLAAAIEDATGRAQVDVVADVVGGDLWPQMIEVLCRGGRYTCAGAIAGPIVEFDLRTFYLNDHTYTGATIVPPGMFAELVGYIERGEIRPLLAKTWPLSELHAAQEAFLQKGHVGNFVVLPPEL
jgi:NADPH:quinone reductase-like Zn-dependent oxidoreductase